MHFRFRPIYQWIFQKLGWRIEGHFPKELPKYLIVAAPHTSNWDFMIGLCVRSIERTEARFLGKKELFRWPFGILFRYLGGYPVDRSKNSNFVDSVVEIFRNKERFITTIAPEATRKRNDNWKSGFYHIAKKAEIPIVMTGFDYAYKRVVIAEPFYISDDYEHTLEFCKQFFRNYKGKTPENGVI